jgi:hypothetical protein
MADSVRISIHVRGTLRGVEVDSDATARVVDETVSILVEDREYTARVDRIDGVEWESGVLTLHVARDTIELTGHAALHSLGAEIMAIALALPELTRTMHGLGSRRGRPGAEHDRFFAGLLAARRSAEGFTEPESRLAAFDARRLTQSINAILSELAAERFPESAPDRRALEAELLEYAERLQLAIDALGSAADAVRAGNNAVRLARWRDWTRAAQRVFEEADRCWIAVLPALSAAPVRPPRRTLWKRAKK